MSQRNSGYSRIENERYETPSWVVRALCGYLDVKGITVWEPACGNGHMVKALRECGAIVTASDIEPGIEEAFKADFLKTPPEPVPRASVIVTNPPFGPRGSLSVAFLERSMGLLDYAEFQAVAMLLPVDFDSAKGRVHLFSENPYFTAKIVLLRRIAWVGMEPGPGQPGPSSNHAWFVWERQFIRRLPVVLYATGQDS